MIADDAPDPHDPTLEEIAARLLPAMLPHVPFEGWSAAARDAAADDLGVDRALAALALPDAAAMVDAFTARADRMMAEAMAAAGVQEMKIRDRIRTALVTRLEQAAMDREAVRRALLVLALPANAALAARTLWRSVDAMWRAAGDTATDFNHYSKRLILSGIYSATLLYWLEDDSDDFAETRAFIDRRIDDVMRIEKAKASAREAFAWVPNPVRILGRLRYPAR